MATVQIKAMLQSAENTQLLTPVKLILLNASSQRLG